MAAASGGKNALIIVLLSALIVVLLYQSVKPADSVSLPVPAGPLKKEVQRTKTVKVAKAVKAKEKKEKKKAEKAAKVAAAKGTVPSPATKTPSGASAVFDKSHADRPAENKPAAPAPEEDTKPDPLEDVADVDKKADELLKKLSKQPRDNSFTKQPSQVAVCVSGMASSFRSRMQEEALFRFLVFPNKAHGFLHLYANSANERQQAAALEKLPYVKDLRVEPFGQRVKEEIQSELGVRSDDPDLTTYALWRKVHMCVEMVHEYERRHNVRYQRIVRVDPDLMLNLPVDVMKCPAGKLCIPGGRTSMCPECPSDDKTCFVPKDCGAPCCGMVNDNVAVGSPELIDKYAETYFSIANVTLGAPSASWPEHRFYQSLRARKLLDRVQRLAGRAVPGSSFPTLNVPAEAVEPDEPDEKPAAEAKDGKATSKPVAKDGHAASSKEPTDADKPAAGKASKTDKPPGKADDTSSREDHRPAARDKDGGSASGGKSKHDSKTADSKSSEPKSADSKAASAKESRPKGPVSSVERQHSESPAKASKATKEL